LLLFCAVSFFIGLGLIFVIVLDSQYGQAAFMSAQHGNSTAQPCVDAMFEFLL